MAYKCYLVMISVYLATISDLHGIPQHGFAMRHHFIAKYVQFYATLEINSLAVVVYFFILVVFWLVIKVIIQKSRREVSPIKAMKSSLLLRPFCGSEFWAFSWLKYKEVECFYVSNLRQQSATENKMHYITSFSFNNTTSKMRSNLQ